MSKIVREMSQIVRNLSKALAKTNIWHFCLFGQCFEKINSTWHNSKNPVESHWRPGPGIQDFCQLWSSNASWLSISQSVKLSVHVSQGRSTRAPQIQGSRFCASFIDGLFLWSFPCWAFHLVVLSETLFAAYFPGFLRVRRAARCPKREINQERFCNPCPWYITRSPS